MNDGVFDGFACRLLGCGCLVAWSRFKPTAFTFEGKPCEYVAMTFEDWSALRFFCVHRALPPPTQLTLNLNA